MGVLVKKFQEFEHLIVLFKHMNLKEELIQLSGEGCMPPSSPSPGRDLLYLAEKVLCASDLQLIYYIFVKLQNSLLTLHN